MELVDLNVRVVNDSYLNKVYIEEIKIVKPKIPMFDGLNSA